MKRILFSLTTIALLAACAPTAQQQSPFVTVKDGHFERDGKPYYYVGTNFWYGAILGSEGQGGNRQRLCRELDEMKRMGIDNLRILVGSDGERGVATKVEPTLQVAPGVYNDTILAGLPAGRDAETPDGGRALPEQRLGVEWRIWVLLRACRSRQAAASRCRRLPGLHAGHEQVCH